MLREAERRMQAGNPNTMDLMVLGKAEGRRELEKDKTVGGKFVDATLALPLESASGWRWADSVPRADRRGVWRWKECRE